VRSPLAKQMAAVRPSGFSAWSSEYGKFEGKDYAVISRFRYHQDGQDFFHYFIAGIRGLGTWGAGYYIDTHPDRLAAVCGDDDKDVQVLLEVTYRNFRIAEVADVSDKPAEYFAEAYSNAVGP
jgi:hypothetical protein